MVRGASERLLEAVGRLQEGLWRFQGGLERLQEVLERFRGVPEVQEGICRRGGVSRGPAGGRPGAGRAPVSGP